MLANLLKMYDRYPAIMLSLRGLTRGDLAPDLLSELETHGERQREILSVAQVYQIDEQAEVMLRNLSMQMQIDGLDSMYSSVRLPFPAMLLTIPETQTGFWPAALITQDEDALYTQVFFSNDEGSLPNLLIFESRGTSVDVRHSPSLKLARAYGDDITDDAAMEQEKSLCFMFLSIAVGMSVLFDHNAMLEKDEVPAYPRAERRRHQKSGRPLPNRRIIKVKLGELGKRQLQATQEIDDHGDEERQTRRAHWVRGHMMRNRAGGLSWRNPHVRGAGPIIEQERRVSFDED
ncbi:MULTISPECIES: hypothetical protein [unclassified Ruegeria]|uniref:hypothetical protein n=1 Tax=unclassified Ruegeria TaxID=2625375 RepID=UPI00148A07A0|nr:MULTISPECIES: hypothetical protein [unclassified Ruegeria]